MKKKLHTQGFTLIEILVVLAIIGIIASVTSVAFQSMNEKATKEAGVNELFGALTQARSKTLSSQNDSVYGVYVSSTTVVRFEGASYVPTDSSNKIYNFEGSIEAASNLFAPSGVSVVFSQLVGRPSATGTIFIRREDGTATSSVIIHDTGLIEID